MLNIIYIILYIYLHLIINVYKLYVYKQFLLFDKREFYHSSKIVNLSIWYK